MKSMATAFLAEVALISWRNLHNDKTAPPPSQYTGAAIFYGLLALAPDSWSPATSTLGWAFVLATFLNLWNPQTPLNLTTKAAASSSTISSTTATPASGNAGVAGIGPSKIPLQPA